MSVRKTCTQTGSCTPIRLFVSHLDLVNLLVEVLHGRVNLPVYAVVNSVVMPRPDRVWGKWSAWVCRACAGRRRRPRKHLCPIPRVLPRPEPLLHPFRRGRWVG